MTNVFTNKKKRRYYYYKCVKVAKEGKDACPLKAVNAEKLESFIFENLERISQDRNYVESLAFKILRNLPHQLGNELTDESEKQYTERALHVLQKYVSDYRNGTQVEKVLINQRTIQKIFFSKNTLEVVVSLIDKTESKLDNLLSGKLSGSFHGAREGVVPAGGRSANSGNPDILTRVASSQGEKLSRERIELSTPSLKGMCSTN